MVAWGLGVRLKGHLLRRNGNVGLGDLEDFGMTSVTWGLGDSKATFTLRRHGGLRTQAWPG